MSLGYEQVALIAWLITSPRWTSDEQCSSEALHLAFVQVLTADRTVWLDEIALRASADSPGARTDVHTHTQKVRAMGKSQDRGI